MRKSDTAQLEIEFPGRYVLNEARFPEISEKIRNKEAESNEPPSPFQ